MINSLLIVSTVINGLRSKQLSQLVAGYMVNLPFQFHLFQDGTVKSKPPYLTDNSAEHSKQHRDNGKQCQQNKHQMCLLQR